MKKIFLFLLAFFVFHMQVLAASFPDVPADHKNYNAIEYLSAKQIINGFQDHTFGPDKLLSRADALKIIVGAMKIDISGSYDVLFPDVKKGDWFFSFVMGTKAAGIVSGYKDAKFHPDNPLSLADTLKILFLAAKVKLPDVTDDIFTDVKKTDWFAPYMLYARDHNILFSDDYGAVHPDQSMNRASFAEVVYRLLIVLENNGTAFPLALNWKQYQSTVLPFAIKYDDKNWKVFEESDQIIFLKADKQYSQFSPARIYPNSGVVTVTLDQNPGQMVVDQYFTNTQKAFPGAKYTKFKLKDLNAMEVLSDTNKTVDWYVYLASGKVLVVYTQYGDGPDGLELQRDIKAMLGTLAYTQLPAVGGEDYTNLLSTILSNILVKAKGMEMINSLPDKLIISTDTIGAGNGAVDYYYSKALDYSFKYERSDDVILDSRKGKTSAF